MKRPYDPSPLPGKKLPTSFIAATLPSGATIKIGLQRNHPHGGDALVHEFENEQPDGYRSFMRFSLTKEAAKALIYIYLSHGVMDEEPPNAHSQK